MVTLRLLYWFALGIGEVYGLKRLKGGDEQELEALSRGAMEQITFPNRQKHYLTHCVQIGSEGYSASTSAGEYARIAIDAAINPAAATSRSFS
jgi:hypothetical protein